MKLSMYTISEWLQSRGYHPTNVISSGEPCLSGVRIEKKLSDCQNDMLSIVDAKYIPIGQAFQTALINGRDMIFLENEDLYTVHNEAAKAFEYYSNWQFRALSCIAEKCPIQTLVDLADEIFHRPMCVRSNSTWAYALSKGYSSDVFPYWDYYLKSVTTREVDYSTEITASTSPNLGEAFLSNYPVLKESPHAGVGHLIHANVFLEGKLFAVIFLFENKHPFNPGEVHLMKQFVDLLEALISINHEFYNAMPDISKGIISLIEGRPVPNTYMANINLTKNWSPNDEFAVCCIKCLSNNTDTLQNALLGNLPTHFPHSHFLAHRNLVVGVFNITKESGYHEVLLRLDQNIPAKIYCWGLSYNFTGFEQISVYYAQALQALNLAFNEKKNRKTTFQVAFNLLSQTMCMSESLPALLHPDWRTLSNYDQRNGTAFVQTLYAYLVCGCNYTETAAVLNLHRNGVIYRLSRIQEIIQSDLNDFSNKQLLLATYPLISLNLL